MESREERKIEIMEKCFDCYCESGLRDTGIKALAKACGMTSPNLYAYFENVDDLIVKSTAYCMAKVEEDFMNIAPKSAAEITHFLDILPKWTAERHGKKYRFMYQVYSSPKYLEYGKKFFEGVTKRYTEYAKLLEPMVGIKWEIIQPTIFILVRAVVHYALFEEEEYTNSQMKLIKAIINVALNKNSLNENNIYI